MIYSNQTESKSSGQSFTKATWTFTHSVIGTVSHGAALLELILKEDAWRDGTTRMSRAEMAERLGDSERSIRRYLGELEAAGRIAQVRQGPGRPNRIVVVEVVEDLAGRRQRPRTSTGSQAASPTVHYVRNDWPQEATQTGLDWPQEASLRRDSLYKNIDVPHVDKRTTTLHSTDSPRSVEAADPDPVVVVLCEKGMNPNAASALARQYTPEKCQLALGLLERAENVTNPAGFLYRAIVNGWDFPPEEKRRLEREAERKRRKREQDEAFMDAWRKGWDRPDLNDEQLLALERETQREAQRKRAENYQGFKVPDHLIPDVVKRARERKAALNGGGRT